MLIRRFAPVALALLAGIARAANTPEVEPNDTKAQAQVVTLAPGDSISGSTTGASTTTPGNASADTWRIKTAPAAPGIYRYTLSLNSELNAFTTSIRGRDQDAQGVINPASDALAQAGFLDGFNRVNVWYGIGREEEVYYRVDGTQGSVAGYIATLTREPVSIEEIPTPIAGAPFTTIRMVASGPTTDPELWVLNGSTYEPIPDYNNDDTRGAGLVSTLTRPFPTGSYIIAASDHNLMTNFPSPADDASRLQVVLDFPNAIASSDREGAAVTLNIGIHLGLASDPIVAARTLINTTNFQTSFLRFTISGGGPACPADTDDGTRTGTPDGAVTIDDLIYFLIAFEDGILDADLDGDGVNPPNPDGAVTIDDLIFFLLRFEDGC